MAISFCFSCQKIGQFRRFRGPAYWTLVQCDFEIDIPLYPVKYFAARDCAPAPNILPAALLPSSFRNKDFASFFSYSDTSAVVFIVVSPESNFLNKS